MGLDALFASASSLSLLLGFDLVDLEAAEFPGGSPPLTQFPKKSPGCKEMSSHCPRRGVLPFPCRFWVRPGLESTADL